MDRHRLSLPDSLYDRPDLYDLVAVRDEAMERFYIEEALSDGRRVLELACGSGRLTLPIAAAGAQVVGGDLSEPMLDRARAAARGRGLGVDFLKADMRGFDLGGARFDTVIVPANSILHLATPEDFSGFFASVRRHLTPGGRLVFDAFVPSVRLLSADPGERHLLGSFGPPGDGAVTIEETTRYDPIAQVSHLEWYWSAPGRPDFWHCALEMRQVFPQEMPVLLASGGFRLAARFGDFDRSPLTAASRRQVCVCVPA